MIHTAPPDAFRTQLNQCSTERQSLPSGSGRCSRAIATWWGKIAPRLRSCHSTIVTNCANRRAAGEKPTANFAEFSGSTNLLDIPSIPVEMVGFRGNLLSNRSASTDRRIAGRELGLDSLTARVSLAVAALSSSAVPGTRNAARRLAEAALHPGPNSSLTSPD